MCTKTSFLLPNSCLETDENTNELHIRNGVRQYSPLLALLFSFEIEMTVVFSICSGKKLSDSEPAEDDVLLNGNPYILQDFIGRLNDSATMSRICFAR